MPPRPRRSASTYSELLRPALGRSASSLPARTRCVTSSPQALPQPAPDDIRGLVAAGLEAARAAGASWADVRFEEVRNQTLACEDDHLVYSGDDSSYGVGVRAIVDGAWGFAATWRADRDGVVAMARRAVALARANRRLVGRKGVLAPQAKAVGKWSSPFEIDPFVVPLAERAESLRSVARAVLARK